MAGEQGGRRRPDVAPAGGQDATAFITSDDRGPDYGPEFYAGYGGECYQCYEPIDEGDLIRGVGNGDYVHADCFEDWLSEQ
jgi:hypothetical protein